MRVLDADTHTHAYGLLYTVSDAIAIAHAVVDPFIDTEQYARKYSDAHTDVA